MIVCVLAKKLYIYIHIYIYWVKEHVTSNKNILGSTESRKDTEMIGVKLYVEN